MTLNETHIRELLDQATPGPWEYCGAGIRQRDDDDEYVIDMNRYWAHEDTNRPEDFTLAARAPELAADWLRMREALEKQLNGINLMIALADMIQPQTEAQQTAITLARALRDDLTRILNGEHNA